MTSKRLFDSSKERKYQRLDVDEADGLDSTLVRNNSLVGLSRKVNLMHPQIMNN